MLESSWVLRPLYTLWLWHALFPSILILGRPISQLRVSIPIFSLELRGTFLSIFLFTDGLDLKLLLFEGGWPFLVWGGRLVSKRRGSWFWSRVIGVLDVVALAHWVSDCWLDIVLSSVVLRGSLFDSVVVDGSWSIGHILSASWIHLILVWVHLIHFAHLVHLSHLIHLLHLFLIWIHLHFFLWRRHSKHVLWRLLVHLLFNKWIHFLLWGLLSTSWVN